MWKVVTILGLVIVAGVALLVPLSRDVSDGRTVMRVAGVDLSGYSSAAPAEPIDIVFLHHSVGAQLLAAPGPREGGENQPTRHPNGGGLAALLAQNNYRLHTATYGSALGERTDLFDWLPKFRDDMDRVIAIRNQDEKLPAGEVNRVVMFKSCFPNSYFVGEGDGAGNPAGPDLTLANARATMNAVRDELARRPSVLFVYLTAPPLASRPSPEPAWKWLAKRALGRTSNEERLRTSGDLARRFDNWVTDPQGWLKGYPHRNVVVFDLYDALTDHGASNFSRYATGGGLDSHPSSEGNAKVAPELVSFLNRAVRYAGVVK